MALCLQAGTQPNLPDQPIFSQFLMLGMVSSLNLHFSYGVPKEQGQAFQSSLPLCTAEMQRGLLPEAKIAMDVPTRPAYLLLDTFANPAFPLIPLHQPASNK